MVGDGCIDVALLKLIGELVYSWGQNVGQTAQQINFLVRGRSGRGARRKHADHHDKQEQAFDHWKKDRTEISEHWINNPQEKIIGRIAGNAPMFLAALASRESLSPHCDLPATLLPLAPKAVSSLVAGGREQISAAADGPDHGRFGGVNLDFPEIGRASCRER